MSIDEYVSNDSYLDSYEERIQFGVNTVYEAWNSTDVGACTGYPCYLLVSGGTIRRATLEEIHQIMGCLHSEKDE